MNEFANLRVRLPGIVKALAVGIPAGYLFAVLRTPIPWMIGPMVAVAALNLLGVRMHSPPFARQMGQVILGSAVSLYFTPMVVAELGGNLPAIVAATVAVFVVGGLGALTLSRASGVDGKSTFFASIPGGAMSMAVLAERYGAQVAPVAVAHSLRVSVVVILIPFALTYGGIPLVASAYRPAIPLDILILVPWLAFGCVLGEVSERYRFHNGYLLMPIFFGAALTMSGIQLSAVPHGLTDLAQLMFGLVLGARYERAFFARHRLFIPFALLNSFFILLASVAAAAILAWAFDLPIATMIMATAPGGLAEMTIAAQALQISVPLVVAFHLFRVVMVNMGTQYIFTFASWALDRSPCRKKIPKLKRRMPMPRIWDPWDHHDWDSRKYVSQWAERQDQREVDREETFRLIAKVLPYDQEAPMNILDLGAGYGALAQYLLSHFSNATAVCQDGSEEMARLGRKRMERLKGRFEYVFCDFSKRGWSRKIKGPFEAVVSSIAIHNVRSPDIIRAIYSETFALVKPGGCFLNFDRMTPSLKEQMKWLREAGFENVQCFRESGRRALVGGFKEHPRAQ